MDVPFPDPRQLLPRSLHRGLVGAKHEPAQGAVGFFIVRPHRLRENASRTVGSQNHTEGSTGRSACDHGFTGRSACATKQTVYFQ